MFQVDWSPRSDVPSSEAQPDPRDPRSKGELVVLYQTTSIAGATFPRVSGRTLPHHPFHIPCCAVPVNLRARGSIKGGQTRYGVTWLPPRCAMKPTILSPGDASRDVDIYFADVVSTFRAACPPQQTDACHAQTRFDRQRTTDDMPALFPPFPESLSLPALHKKTLAHFFHMPRFPAASLPARARRTLFSSTWTCHQLPLGSRKRQAATWRGSCDTIDTHKLALTLIPQ